MDDEPEVKIIRLIVRLSLFSLLCFFLWAYIFKKAPFAPKPIKLEQNPKYAKPISQSPEPEQETEYAPPENELLPSLKPESALPDKKPKEKAKQLNSSVKSSKPLSKKANSPTIISSRPISSKRESSSQDKNISQAQTEQEQIPESVKKFQEQLRKKYRINALAANYASSLGLSPSQTRSLLRQIVNLNQSNLCAAWRVKRNCPSNSSFEEIGYYAINAQLMPCLQKLKNKEQMLNKKYNNSEKMQFLLSCY